MTLKNKKILLLVSGSIAAFKAVYFMRMLQKNGAEVRVCLTDSAQKFIPKITFSSLTKAQVLDDNLWWKSSEVEHVEFAKWANLVVFLPATSNSIAKLMAGIVDNVLTAAWSSIPLGTPKIIAPAMDLDMAENPIYKSNLDFLKEAYENLWIADSDSGFLASRLEGKGRLADLDIVYKMVESIILTSKLKDYTKCKKRLKNQKVLITAGGTREKIDPVRFITNGSTGKIGWEIAWIFWAFGARVKLISASNNEKYLKNFNSNNSNENLKIIKVNSAIDMFEEVKKEFSSSNIFIASAAVGDFGVKNYSSQKIKKEGFQINSNFRSDLDAKYILELEKNPDILAWTGEQNLKLPSSEKKLLAGFALETEDLEKNATLKLEKKNLDLILANLLTKDLGFGEETEIIIYSKDGEKVKIPFKNKTLIALDIVRTIVSV